MVKKQEKIVRSATSCVDRIFGRNALEKNSILETMQYTFHWKWRICDKTDEK